MRPIFFLLVVSLLASCATVSVKSNKDESYRESLQRVAIIGDGAEFEISIPKTTQKASAGGSRPAPETEYLSKRLGDYMSELTAQKLDGLGVEARPFFSSNISLSGDDLQKQMTEYGPKQVVSWKLTAATVVPMFLTTQLSGGTFDVVVFDVASNRNVWRGSISFSTIGPNGPTAFGSSGAMRVVESVIKKLKDDGLLLVLTPSS